MKCCVVNAKWQLSDLWWLTHWKLHLARVKCMTNGRFFCGRIIMFYWFQQLVATRVVLWNSKEFWRSVQSIGFNGDRSKFIANDSDWFNIIASTTMLLLWHCVVWRRWLKKIHLLVLKAKMLNVWIYWRIGNFGFNNVGDIDCNDDDQLAGVPMIRSSKNKDTIFYANWIL